LDYIPDDLLSKEQVLKLALQDKDLIFKGPRVNNLREARAILLLKKKKNRVKNS